MTTHAMIYKVVKNENFLYRNFDIFILKIDRGYTLEAVLTSTHNLSFGGEIRKIDISQLT